MRLDDLIDQLTELRRESAGAALYEVVAKVGVHDYEGYWVEYVSIDRVAIGPDASVELAS